MSSTRIRGPKAERLEARITLEQKQLFQRAAALAGRSLTDFVVNTLQEAAIRTIREREQIDLSRQDQERFVETLLHPPAPGERLRQAVHRYQAGTDQ